MLNQLVYSLFSSLEYETERAVKSKALQAGVRVLISARKLCLLIIFITLASSLFALSGFRLLEALVIGTGMVNLYLTVAAVSLVLLLMLLNQRLWIKFFGIDKAVNDVLYKPGEY